MAEYDTQQICDNGHQITDRYYGRPEDRKQYCDRCGATTITKCPSCDEEIRGRLYELGTASLASVPAHCHNCGEVYPWTTTISTINQEIKEGKFYDPLLILEQICNRFHLVAKHLRQRHNKRPSWEIQDEYDVQDLFHALLHVFFDDVRPEERNPSYAGGSSRMDFLLKEEEIAVEIKMTRAGLADRELGEQLIVDIEKYQKHPECCKLVCFIYDPEGKITNQHGLEHDLSTDESGFIVKVFARPKAC